MMYLLDSDHAFLSTLVEAESGSVDVSESTLTQPDLKLKTSKPLFAEPSSTGLDLEGHLRIAAHDSLNAMSWIRRVPALNRRQDVGGLVELLRRMVPHAIPPANWTQAEALAAMRDVGLVLGSIRRHGEEPLQHVPELERWLVQIGHKTGLPPRDTLLHYTIWNPTQNLRTYTDLPEEVELIRAVQIAFPALETAVDRLLPLFDLPIRSNRFGQQCAAVLEALQEVRRAAVHTYQNVPREVFIADIRPYFEPIEVNGASYLGPGAVAMPLFIFDHLLWSAPLDDVDYTAFKEDYLPVTLPYLRRLYDLYSTEGCLLDRVEEQWQDASVHQELTARRNLDALLGLFRLLKGFRSVHLRMAQQAYEQGQGPYEKGSGGYSPKMLEHIIDLFQSAEDRLRLLQRGGQAAPPDHS